LGDEEELRKKMGVRVVFRLRKKENKFVSALQLRGLMVVPRKPEKEMNLEKMGRIGIACCLG